MRKTVLPLFAAVALAGCYHYEAPAPAGPAGAHDTWYGRNEPLQADIWYNEFSGNVSLSVSQPAYTSVFLIRPGVGASMIFPRYGDGENYFRQGTHMLSSYYTSGFGRYGWSSAFSSWIFPWRSGPLGYGYPYGYGSHLSWPGYSGYGFGYGGYGYGGYGYGGYGYGYGYDPWMSLTFSQPMYLLLVASTEPLRTDQFLAGRQSMSLRFASYSLTQTTNAITDDVVLFPEYANWTTATYVVWPQAPPMPVYAMAYPYYIRPAMNPLLPGAKPTFGAPRAWQPPHGELPRVPGLPGDPSGPHIPMSAPGTPGTPVPLLPTEPGRLGKPEPLKPQVPSVPVKPVEGTPSPESPPPIRHPEGRAPIDAQPRTGVPQVPRKLVPAAPPGRVSAPDRPPQQRETARRPSPPSRPGASPTPPPRASEPRHSAPSRAAPAPRRSAPAAQPSHRSSPRARPAPRSAPRARPAPSRPASSRPASRPSPRPSSSRPSPPPPSSSSSHHVPPPGH